MFMTTFQSKINAFDRLKQPPVSPITKNRQWNKKEFFKQQSVGKRFNLSYVQCYCMYVGDSDDILFCYE